MDNLLDAKHMVELTGTDCVVARMALRKLVAVMSEHVAEALDENNYAAAVTHNATIADAIELFGKLL